VKCNAVLVEVQQNLVTSLNTKYDVISHPHEMGAFTSELNSRLSTYFAVAKRARRPIFRSRAKKKRRCGGCGGAGGGAGGA